MGNDRRQTRLGSGGAVITTTTNGVLDFRRTNELAAYSRTRAAESDKAAAKRAKIDVMAGETEKRPRESCPDNRSTSRVARLARE